MDLEAARRKALELFPNLLPASDRPLEVVGRRQAEGGEFLAQLAAMRPAGFPLPGLLYFGFTTLLRLTPYGPEEKMRWGLAFDFKDSTFAFELRKLGLRALCEPRDLDSPLLREVLGRARELTTVVERYLASSVVESQLDAGNFTMENLFGALRERYRFLRARAEAEYALPPPPPETIKTAWGESTHYDYGRPSRQGGALAAAAVDAYFSLLEHFFCLALPFSRNLQSGVGAKETLAANWATKAKRVLDLTNSETKRFYDALVEIREEWRNPLAHGGFLGNGGSLHFHVPGVGAFPARLRRTPEGAHAGFQLPEKSFEEITSTFDGFDEHLRCGPLKYAVAWADSGLDAAFDQSSIAQYRAAMTDEHTFASFIEGRHRLHDYHTNMEY